jgi:hypothetical protein
MVIYERPVRDEYYTDSIDCWIQCPLSIHGAHQNLWLLAYVK